jgi:hypothetical protein
LIMSMAYLGDVPKGSKDYLYYRAVIWCIFSYQLCVAVERMSTVSNSRDPSTRHNELRSNGAGESQERGL